MCVCVCSFLLQMFRIPYGRNEDVMQRLANKNRPSVLLQHGLLDSASAWTLNLPTQSLAYLLADAGYGEISTMISHQNHTIHSHIKTNECVLIQYSRSVDVWMGNNRGNTYSQPQNKEQWDFSFDESKRVMIYECVVVYTKCVCVYLTSCFSWWLCSGKIRCARLCQCSSLQDWTLDNQLCRSFTSMNRRICDGSYRSYSHSYSHLLSIYMCIGHDTNVRSSLHECRYEG